MQATSDWDIDGGDDDDRRLAARRLFMYSARALEVATEVSRVFVGHPDVMCCLQGCDRVFQLGRELAVQQGVMIVGPTGVGKTELIRYYRASLPKSNLFEDGLGAVAIRLPVRPHVGQVVGALLRQVRYPLPHVTAPTVAIKTDLLVEALRRNGCRLVFIDEAQHLFSQTRLRSRLTDGTSVSECLRHLMDETPIGLCLAGTDQLLQLQDIDGHLASRLSADSRSSRSAPDRYGEGSSAPSTSNATPSTWAPSTPRTKRIGFTLPRAATRAASSGCSSRPCWWRSMRRATAWCRST